MDEGGTLTEKAAFGEYARVYDYTGSGNALADTMNESMELGVGTFALTDTRDSKDYLVRRLADGNCWMVQNLDLDLNQFTSDKTARLTPENTDVTETWIPDKSVNDKIAQYLQDGKIAENTFEAFVEWQLGASGQTQQYQNSTQYGATWYWGTRRNNDTDTYESISGTTIKNNQYSYVPRSYDNTIYGSSYVRYIGTDASTGKVYKTVDSADTTSAVWVEGGTADNADIATTTNGFNPSSKLTTPGADASILTDDSWNFYGSMYVGKYYNYYSATAETGPISGNSSTISAQATNSICPFGWELPYDYEYVDGQNKSWYNLLINGYNLEVVDTSQGGDNDNSMRARQTPIALTLSGDYIWNGGTLRNRGITGRYFSRTKSTQASATVRLLNVSALEGLVMPQQGTSAQTTGNSIRCVAHGSELNSTESQQAVATTCSANKICYDSNGGTGTMSDQNANANASVVLTAPTFTRLGYAFAGWSTQDNGFGTVYGPNETITAPSTQGTSGLRLYAKWLPASTQYTMQTFTSTACTNLGMHQTIALRDERDDNVYTVTKLKDDNCWMTTNLALNLADFAGDNPKGYLTTENTDIGNDKDGSGNPTRTDLIDVSSNNGGNSGLYRWDPEKSSRDKFVALGLGTVAEYNFSALATKLLGQAQPNQFQSSGQTGYIWGSIYQDADDGNGGRTYSGSQVLNTEGEDILIDDTTYKLVNNANAEMPRTYARGNNAYGTYMNWYAATAESGTVAMGINTDAYDSVCPKGWRMPKISSNYVPTWYSLLVDTYGYENTSNGSKALRQSPISLLWAGYIQQNGAFYDGGQQSASYYWTIDSYKDGAARMLSVRGNGFNALNNSNKTAGFFVRCFLK